MRPSRSNILGLAKPTGKWFGLLLLAYVCTLPFLQVISLPGFEKRVQLPELIFVPLLVVTIWYRRGSFLNSKHWFSLVLLAYILVNLTSSLLSANFTSILESGGRVYLVLLMLLTADFIRQDKRQGNQRLYKLLQAWRVGVIVACCLAIFFYALATMDISSTWVSRYDIFPYFGSALRMSGPPGHPAMLVLVAAVPTVWTYYRWRNGKESGRWLFLFLPVLVLTFSKEILLVVAAMLLVDPLIRQGRWLRWLIVGGTALLFWGLTHFLLLEKNDLLASQLDESIFTSGGVVWSGEDKLLATTCYVATKRAGLIIGVNNLLLGVGPGNFNAELAQLKASGQYPTHLPDYDPHSTFTGTFAETGIAGFVLFLVLIISLWAMVITLPSRVSEETICLSVFLLMILIGSVSMDVMNHRYLWLAIGVVYGLHSSSGESFQQISSGFER